MHQIYHSYLEGFQRVQTMQDSPKWSRLKRWTLTKWSNEAGTQHDCELWCMQSDESNANQCWAFAMEGEHVLHASYDILRDVWLPTQQLPCARVQSRITTSNIAVSSSRNSILFNSCLGGVYEVAQGTSFPTIQQVIAKTSSLVCMDGELHLLDSDTPSFTHRVWNGYSVRCVHSSDAVVTRFSALRVTRVGCLTESCLVGLSRIDGGVYSYTRGSWRAIAKLPDHSRSESCLLHHYCVAGSPCGRYAVFSRPTSLDLFVVDLESRYAWRSSVRLPCCMYNFEVACMMISPGIACARWIGQWVRSEKGKMVCCNHISSSCVELSREFPVQLIRLFAIFLGVPRVGYNLHVIGRDQAHYSTEMAHVLIESSD